MPESSLEITFCRYVDGKVTRCILPVAGTKYLAVSHCWGKAQWQTILGIEDEVMASKEKVDFIVEQLSSIVGEDAFWMDILCVNQRDRDARIAVTQHIPTIFRQAQRTIVIRDGTGFGNCCAEALGDRENYLGDGKALQSLIIDHYGEMHRHPKLVFTEGAFSRAWILQEILLSDTIQFVRASGSQKYGERLSSVHEAWADLNQLAGIWAHRSRSAPSIHKEVISAFVYGFMNCSTVSRLVADVPNIVHNVSDDITMFWSSGRETSKARDFILAVMPQYEFYKMPIDTKRLTFGQLFVDAYRQIVLAEERGYLAPLLTAHIDIEQLESIATSNIPEPRNLSEFARLLCGATLLRPNRTIPDVAKYCVDVQEPSKTETVFENLLAISNSIHGSKSLWNMNAFKNFYFPEVNFYIQDDSQGFADRESHFATSEPGLDMAEVFRMLLYMVTRIHFDQKSPMEVAMEIVIKIRHFGSWNEVPTFINCLLRLTALVSCGPGIGAYEWSKENLAPVLVSIRGVNVPPILALAPYSVVRSACPPEYSLMRAEGLLTFTENNPDSRVALVAKDQGSPVRWQMCLFPPEVLWG